MKKQVTLWSGPSLKPTTVPSLAFWSSGLRRLLLALCPVNFSNHLGCRSTLFQNNLVFLRDPSSVCRPSLPASGVLLPGWWLGRAPARFNPALKHCKAQNVSVMLLKFVCECELETYLIILPIAQLLTVEIEHAHPQLQRQTSISESVQSSHKEEGEDLMSPDPSLFMRLPHTKKLVLSPLSHHPQHS